MDEDMSLLERRRAARRRECAALYEQTFDRRPTTSQRPETSSIVLGDRDGAAETPVAGRKSTSRSDATGGGGGLTVGPRGQLYDGKLTAMQRLIQGEFYSTPGAALAEAYSTRTPQRAGSKAGAPHVTPPDIHMANVGTKQSEVEGELHSPRKGTTSLVFYDDDSHLSSGLGGERAERGNDALPMDCVEGTPVGPYHHGGSGGTTPLSSRSFASPSIERIEEEGGECVEYSVHGGEGGGEGRQSQGGSSGPHGTSVRRTPGGSPSTRRSGGRMEEYARQYQSTPVSRTKPGGKGTAPINSQPSVLPHGEYDKVKKIIAAVHKQT